MPVRDVAYYSWKARTEIRLGNLFRPTGRDQLARNDSESSFDSTEAMASQESLPPTQQYQGAPNPYASAEEVTEESRSQRMTAQSELKRAENWIQSGDGVEIAQKHWSTVAAPMCMQTLLVTEPLFQKESWEKRWFMERVICGRGIDDYHYKTPYYIHDNYDMEPHGKFFLKQLIHLYLKDDVIWEVWSAQVLLTQEGDNEVIHPGQLQGSYPSPVHYLMKKPWQMETSWILQDMRVEMSAVKLTNNEPFACRNTMTELWVKPNRDGPNEYRPSSCLTGKGNMALWTRNGYQTTACKDFPVAHQWVEETWWKYAPPTTHATPANPNIGGNEEVALFSPERIGTRSPESRTASPMSTVRPDSSDKQIRDETVKRLRLF